MKNTDHKKKMAAPIIITVIFLAYLIAYGAAAAFVFGWSPIMILLAVPLIAIGIGMVYVLRSRIKEIRSGEEDDIGKY